MMNKNDNKSTFDNSSIKELTRSPELVKFPTPSKPQNFLISFLKKRLFFLISILFVGLVVSAYQLSLKVNNVLSNRILNLKSQRTDFVGRTNYLHLLAKELCEVKNNSPVKLKGLWGKGGFGKSELAIQFANIHLSKYSLVWTFYCDSEQQLEQSYRDLADRLNILIPTDPPEKIRQTVHSHLENSSYDHPWLLIYDNLVNPLTDYPKKGGIILVTSQKMVLDSDSMIEILPFSKEEGRELLEQITHKNEPTASECLVNELMGVPLLISNAAYNIRAIPGYKISDYQKLFSTHLHGKEGPLWAKMDSLMRYEKSFATSWKITLQSIEKENPLAARMLFACSYLHPERIPAEWVDLWEENQTSYAEKKTILKCLQNHGVIRYEEKTHTFSIHRFFQDIIRAERNDKIEKDINDAICLLVQHARDYDYYDFSSWERGKLWHLHASELKEKWLSMLQSQSYATMSQVTHVYEGLGNWCYFNDLYPAALDAYNESLKSQKELFGELSFEMGTTHVYIGRVLIELGQYADTLHHCNSAQKNFKALRQENTPQFALSLHVIARVVFQKGEHEEALRLHQQALQIYAESGGTFNIENGICLYNIGLCFGHLGQTSESIKLFDKSLEIFQQSCGKWHPLYARSLYGKAWAIHRQKNYRLALKYFQQAHDIFISSQGRDLAYLAHCWNRIGRCKLDLHQYRQARETFKKALERGTECYGKYTRPVEHSYNGIAWSYLKAKHPQKGLKYLLKQLDVCCHVYNDAPKRMAHILENFQEGLNAAKASGAPTKVVHQAAHRAYCVSQEKLGDDHSLTRFFKNEYIQTGEEKC